MPPTSHSAPSATLSPDTINALVSGSHGNPFGELGPHPMPNGASPGGEGVVIRAFLPRAEQLELLDPGLNAVAEMQRIHPDGLFEITLPDPASQWTDYRLRLNGWVVLDDPYRFGSLISNDDQYWFSEGTHIHAYRWLGANPRNVAGIDGVWFTTWAPSARRVSVVGEFNDWDGRRHVMRNHPASGVWEIFIPGVANLARYKFEIISAEGNLLPLKADPFARSMEHPPQTASRVIDDRDFGWNDDAWMSARASQHHLDQAVSIYEVHAGSWRRRAEDGNRYLSYLELADELIPYVQDMGFTHIQLMPISEFPFDGSWGYQPVGMFAPTIRFGTPDEFRQFVDRCHQAHIGVLLDWVPGHFPTDEHGIGRFDGSCLYEHEDPRKGFHLDWNTLIYNYGRSEVKSYLLSNANFWLEEFHLDGLRVDAVASMLYLDYSREEGEWIPNEHGGRENLEAIELLRTVNSRMYEQHPGIMMIAEESTAWPGVSAPVYDGGLGFGFKWNMGWMNDSLQYMQRDPLYRRYHDNEMAFSTVYAWTEHFILPLSHDEVVHGKRSLIYKMPGDDWQRFANLRAYLAFMWAHPGKKLLFMGGEFGQTAEWNHDQSLDWHLLEYAPHAGLQTLVRDLNRHYQALPALFRRDNDPGGFQWVPTHTESMLAWIRHGTEGDPAVLMVCNLTPRVLTDIALGVPFPGRYLERVNTDASDYGGSGQGNAGAVETVDELRDGQPHTLRLLVPPLATVYFEHSN
ncbi:MAG: 1,4-alpha-glucan branching protein GlgB [Gammaproteobacteria bacterium]